MAEILTFRPRPRAGTERLAPTDQRHVRAEIEDAAQSALDTADMLIAMLDTMFGDPDAEDGADDEPSLGAPEQHDNQVVWFRGSCRDLELDQQPETSQ